MKKQRIVHVIAVILQITGAVMGWRYMPPWLLHNPGVIILVFTFIISDIAHFFLHDK